MLTEPIAVDVEWLDAQTNLHKPLRLLFHLSDRTVELASEGIMAVMFHFQAHCDYVHSMI
jgi:hypothetical protein